MTSTPTPTPSERRASLKAELSRELARARLDHQLDQSDVADAAGVDDALVNRWESTRCADTIDPTAIVLAAERSRPFALRMLRWIADRVRVDLSELNAAHEHVQVVTIVHRFTGAMRAACNTDADGWQSVAECRNELSELDDLLTVVHARRQQLHRSIASGGAPSRPSEEARRS